MDMGDLVTGVVAGVVAALIWTGIEWWRRRQRNSVHFGHLGGVFRITKKLAEQPEPETASIKIVGNVLEVDYEGMPEGDSVHGEIEMSEIFPRSGRGHYLHVWEGKPLWGVWELQVKDDDTLLLRATYPNHKTLEETTHGYVLTRISP